MAYDMFVAICHTLCYAIIMREELSFTVGWILALFLCQCPDPHPPPGSIVLFWQHCSPPLLWPCCPIKLSWSDTLLNALVIFTVGFLVLIFPKGLLLSYSSIGVSILMGPSTKGICKDLSTCGYHLSAVSLFYGASTSVYISSSSVHHCFHDVHSGLLHAEHFHLQPEKQRHDIGSGEYFQKQ